MALRRKCITNPNLAKEKIAVEHLAFYGYVQRYFEVMRVRNYSARTVKTRDSNLRRFIAWCEDRGLDDPQCITKPILERYQTYLYHYSKANV